MSHLAEKVQSFKAGADLSALQYTFVKFGADDKTVVGCGAGERAIGILQNSPALGQVAEVARKGGGSYLKLGATVARGAIIKSGALGVGVKAAAANDWCYAQSMESGVVGDIVSVDVGPIVAGGAEA